MLEQIENIITGDIIVWGRPLLRWYMAAFAIIGFMLVALVLKWFGAKKYKQHKGEVENNFSWKILTYMLLRKISFWASLVIAIYIAAEAINPPARFDKYFKAALILFGFFQLFIWANAGINIYSHQKLRSTLSKDPSSSTAIRIFSLIWKFAAFSILTLLMLDQLGFNITTLLAGLGVGGIAVALAMQNILGDLFASLTIVFDKPFKVGDVVRIDQMTGTIEEIGLKTTRIRSNSGEQIIMSNNDILKARIQNFYEIKERRVSYILGVTYNTAYEKMKMIPNLLDQAVLSQPKTRADRAYFKDYGESALNFEVSYLILEADVKKASDIQHGVNLEILRLFEENKISFAFPSRTIYLQNPTPS